MKIWGNFKGEMHAYTCSALSLYYINNRKVIHSHTYPKESVSPQFPHALQVWE